MNKRASFILLFFILVGSIYSQVLTIKKPNGGENWRMNTWETITWVRSGFTGDVRLILFRNGVRIGFIVKNIGPEVPSYGWFVGRLADGTTVVPGTGYKIRIKKQGTGTLLFDNSDNPFTITPPKLPDLCISGRVTVTPERPKMHDTVTIKAIVKNCGELPSGRSRAKLTIKGPEGFHQVIKYLEVPALSPVPGGMPTIHVIEYRHIFSQMGVYRSTVTIDYNNSVKEQNENNNEKSRSYIVAPLPDLAVYIPAVKDVHVGRERTVTFEVRNIGPGLSPTSTLHTFLDGENVKTYSIPPLRQNEKRVFKRSHRWFIPGKKLYTTCIDCNNKIRELDENNNKKQGHVKVYVGSHFDESGTGDASPCGLVITFSAPKKVKLFEKVAIVAYIKNPWTFKSPPAKMDFRIEGHRTISWHIPELYPKQTHKIPYTVQWTREGTKQFSAKITSGKNCSWASGSIFVEGLKVRTIK